MNGLAARCSIVLIAFASLANAAHAQTSSGRNLAAACFTCHGTEGRSVEGIPPALAGRAQTELFNTLQQFKTGQRPATIMHQQAKGYTDEQLQQISAYFASVKPGPSAAIPRASR